MEPAYFQHMQRAFSKMWPYAAVKDECMERKLLNLIAMFVSTGFTGDAFFYYLKHPAILKMNKNCRIPQINKTQFHSW